MGDEIYIKIKTILARILRTDIIAIDEGASADTIENWDSLRHMKLVMALEEEFNVHFSEKQIVEMTSFPKIVVAITQSQK